MLVEAQITINGSKATAWAVITDIEHAAQHISGITKIEIVERPAHGLVGLRWRETRLLFGKPATVEKWITDAVDHESYTTRAEDGGFVFLTSMALSGSNGAVTLTSSHDSRPHTVVARVMSIPMVLFFKGVVRKAVQKDLDEYKAAVEGKSSAAPRSEM